MSNLAKNEATESDPEQGKSGPNLILLYTLLVVAILAAVGFAAMVVWPFYQRR
jgi:hypothetical protein